MSIQISDTMKKALDNRTLGLYKYDARGTVNLKVTVTVL